jgi:DNA replication and repair protein RecF
VASPDERGAGVGLVYVDALKEAWATRPARGGELPAEDELVEAYRRRIADVRQREAWNGVSLVGPQRDDLRAELDERDVALHASRGQQRTIILALKLAETDLLGAGGPRPILLLDDVFSELDPDRSARLSELLAGRGQAIVSTADPGTLEAARQRDAAIWRIVDGRLEPET